MKTGIITDKIRIIGLYTYFERILNLFVELKTFCGKSQNFVRETYRNMYKPQIFVGRLATSGATFKIPAGDLPVSRQVPKFRRETCNNHGKSKNDGGGFAASYSKLKNRIYLKCICFINNIKILNI